MAKTLRGRRVRAPWIDALGITVYLTDELPDNIKARLQGKTLVLNSRYEDELVATIMHEMEHIRQDTKFGPAARFVYTGGAIVGAVRGDPYGKNPLEVAAEEQATRYEKRVQAEQIARRQERGRPGIPTSPSFYTIEQTPEQIGFDPSASARASDAQNQDENWNIAYVQSLSQLYGVDADFIRRRWQVLKDLMPEEVLQKGDAFLKWWNQLGAFDKVFAIGIPLPLPQPLIRDTMRTTAIINKDPRLQEFFSNSDNAVWWYFGQKGGTPGQKAFAKWYNEEWNRILGSGTATQEYLKSPYWAQFRADLVSGIPSMLVTGATGLRMPLEIAMEKVLYPGLRLAWRGLRAVSPGTARLFMRESHRAADLMVEQFVKRIKALDVPEPIRRELLEKARPHLETFRRSWIESARQKAMIEADGRQLIGQINKRLGTGGDHWRVAERVLAEKNNVWKEWLAVTQERVAGIDNLKAQLTATTDPAARAVIQQKITMAQTQLKTAATQFRARLQGITVDKVVKGDPALGLDGMALKRFTPEDASKVGQLMGSIKTHLDALYPPGKEGFQPFYFPEPNEAFAGHVARLKAFGAVTKWWEIERWMVGASQTGEQAMNKFAYRLSAPRVIQAAESQRALLTTMIDDLSSDLGQTVSVQLRESLRAAGIEVSEKAASNIVTATLNPVMTFWRNSVLAGRFIPWTTMNVIGNTLNSVENLVVKNWMRGRWVNPVTFLKGMVDWSETPLYAMEAFGRRVGREGGRDVFSRAMGKLYGVNAWIESAFRSGVYRAEFEIVSKELAAKGVARIDIPELAARHGWDTVDRVMLNYGDKYWAAKWLQPIAPFTTFKVENLKFWMKEMAENPWMLRAMVQTVQEHPEWNIRTEDLIAYFDKRKQYPVDNALFEAFSHLRELGIDGRTIDLVSKANYYDILGSTGTWSQPKWLKDREKVLARDLAEALEKYGNDPTNPGFIADLKQRPELKAYYDYAQQHVAWKLMDFGLGALGTNFLADTALQQVGVQRARKFHTIFPQERLFGLILGNLGKEWGVDLVSKWSEPTDSQLRAEKQLLVMMGLSTGDDAKDTELARHRWWVRNLVDSSLDLGTVSGTLRSDLLDQLYETTRRELGSRAGVNFAPEPERVYRIMEQYRFTGPVGEAWATILAKREQRRDIETATPEQRRGRQAAFDLLPEELKELIQTSGDPADAAFYTFTDDAFARWQKMEPAERRRFLQSNSLEAQVIKAWLDTRYTPQERNIVDQIEGMYSGERQNWFATASAEDREMFRQIYPREATLYDSLDKSGVSPVFPQPSAPDIDTTTPNSPYLFRDPKDGEVSVLRPSQVAVSAPPPSAGPEAKQPPMITAALTPTMYSSEQVARAIGGVETGGGPESYGRLSYIANPGKGHALGKYQFLPQTIVALGYGKYLGSTDPKDFMDPARAKQLAQKWLENPEIQEQAMAGLIRANAKSLGFGEGPYTQEQVGSLALAHVGGVNLAKRVQADPSLANRIMVGPNASTTVAQYRDRVTSNVTVIPPAGREIGKGRAPQPVPPPTKPGVEMPQSPAEWYARRKVNVEEGGLLIDYPGGLLQVMKTYIKRINPDLDNKNVQRIVDTVYSLYADPQSGVPGATRGFDPLWILAIIAERTGFNPDHDKVRSKGIMGLDIGKFPELTDETAYDITKNIKAGVAVFVDIQRKHGTEEAVRRFGVDFKKVEVRGTSIIGLRPVAVTPLDEKRRHRVLGPADDPREQQYADFYAKLSWAGGKPDDPEFLSKRQQEWAELSKPVEPWLWDLLRERDPDRYWAVKEASEGAPYWFKGKFVLEETTPARAEWKHRIRAAQTMEEAAGIYQSGSAQNREWFSHNNPDMALFFKDYLAGVPRDYKNYEFSDDQDAEQYIPARRRLALALATGDVRRIKQTVSEITSIYGDDVAGFTRKLKEDTPSLFEAARPYLVSDALAYGPDDKLKVRQFLAVINDNLEKFRRTGNPEFLQVASAQWGNPENAGLKSLVFDHETDHFSNIERRLAGVPAIGHFVTDEEHVPFQRFAQALQTSYNAKNMEQMRAVWQSAPESFRQEFSTFRDSYWDYEALLNGEEPAAWVDQRERAMAAPYKHFVTMDDTYGAYSPLKLAQVLDENPAAFNYLISDPEFRQNFRAVQEGKVVSLYAGVLRQYNYSPALLNAIPDDGARFMLSLMDPNAAEALKRHKISATRTERPIIPGVKTFEDIYGQGATVEPILENGQPTGKFKVRRTQVNETGAATGSVEEIVVSAQQLQKEYAALLGMQTTAPQFQGIKAQYERNAAIVQGLGLVYQGVRISQAGGGFVEQLPAYFQAAQVAAGAGLFTGPAAAFLTGPAGLLAGGILGILGGIFGENRQRAEEERRRREQEAALRQQAIDQAAQISERIRSMTAQQLEQLAGRQTREFRDRPTAITRQALFDALVVPRPSW